MKVLQVRSVDLKFSPLEVAKFLSTKDAEGLVYFDSSGNLPENYKSAMSIIAAFPSETLAGNSNDFTASRELLAGYEARYDEGVPVSVPAGGLFGGIQYSGEFSFGLYENCLIFDHNINEWYEVGDLQQYLTDLDADDCEVESEESHLDLGDFKPLISKSRYMEMVEIVKEYIASGDIYQVNIAQKFVSEMVSGDLFDLYLALRDSSPAPMAAYLKLADGVELLSSSPETFLSMDGEYVETKPIKGTRPRYDDEEKDFASARELLASEKERAELVMITDLERNDLGQVCEYGSVKVTEMLKLETLEQVYHLVSTVCGKIRSDLDHFDVIDFCFPGGSITGAPKVRAMEIIAELESSPRGYYTGAIGYIGIGGVSQFSITIRTLVRENDEIHYHVGAGIVADSRAEAEYEETLHKAKGILKACGITEI